MKTIDVQSLMNGIDELLPKIKSQKTQIKNLERSVEAFTDLEDSFKGEGGNAIRRFYRDWHLPFLSYRFFALENYEHILLDLKQATAQLESDTNGYIIQSFLDGTLTDGINKAKTVTAGLVDEGNGYMDAVSDIVYLPRLFDGSFHGRAQAATSHIMNTVQDLNIYDNIQTNELSSLDNDINLMKGYLNDLSGIFKDKTYQMSNYNLRLEDYPNYQKLQASLAQKNLTEFAQVFSGFFTTYWTLFAGFFIRNNMDDEPFVYEMLRGYERRYEELEKIANSNIESNTEEFTQGDHQVARGKEMDLAAMEEMVGVSIETFNLRGVPLHYAVIDGKLVIFRDNPDLWYYTQNAEYTVMSEIFGIAGKTTATAIRDYYLGKTAGKIPGAGKLNTELDKLPEIPGSGGTKVGDIGKEQLSETIQGKIPVWGEIISADVPKAGTKEVIVYIDDNGDQYNRRAKFTLGTDGILSIDDWYTGDLNTIKQKEKEKVTFSDIYNWMQDTTDPNNSKTVSEEAKKVVEDYTLKESKDQTLTKGKGLDLNELEFVKDVDINTTAINDVPINYSVIGGELVIFPDNPDIHYYQQNVEYGAGTEVLSQFVQKSLTKVGENQLGNLAGKIPGANDLNGQLDSLPNIYNTDIKTGDIMKGTANQMVHNHLPGWEKIASAPVPKAGEKQVLLSISEDGENISGVKLFRLKDDGTVTMY